MTVRRRLATNDGRAVAAAAVRQVLDVVWSRDDLVPATGPAFRQGRPVGDVSQIGRFVIGRRSSS